MTPLRKVINRKDNSTLNRTILKYEKKFQTDIGWSVKYIFKRKTTHSILFEKRSRLRRNSV